MTVQSTAAAPATLRQHSNSYDIFILVLTIMSLAVMVLLILPLSSAELDALRFYDNLFCVIFLIDFAMNFRGAHPRRAYVVGQRGYIDLLGSIPSLGVIPLAVCCDCSGSSVWRVSRRCCAASGRPSSSTTSSATAAVTRRFSLCS